MVLVALDHTATSLNAWPHGTAASEETDSTPVEKWSPPAAYVIRTLIHLYAPGLTFLFGIGVVYFGRSRTSLMPGKKWSNTRLARHFIVRGAVLALVSEVMGLVMSLGRFWIFNVLLISLAVDYVLAGILWLVIARMEMELAVVLLKVLPEREEDDPSEPLLRPRSDDEVEMEVTPDRRIIRAGSISWHLHNALLAVLAVVMIWWNVWLSPTGGRCGVEERRKLPDAIWLRIWFYQVFEGHIISEYPPLAWMSFAILGLLYGRIILARTWSVGAITLGNSLAGLMFVLLFVLTRVFHFGNLSEGCLQMAEHAAAGKNQYLASPASFFHLIKYPPDVAFWAYTMAGNHFLLAVVGAIPPHIADRALHVLLVFGTSALFFFVLDMFVALGLGAMTIALVGHDVGRPNFWSGKPYGVDQLWAFFLSWALLLAIMYPLCKWYGGFKRSKGPDSLWRFF